jgi:tetratricopeptide (TPR) repeat protein/predicted Ser/Thr protein kinase
MAGPVPTQTQESSGGAGPPASQLPRGATLGRYVVLDVVGEGGMGFVYAAYDFGLDRKVALKVLRTAAADQQRQLRLLDEARAMAKLSHPNVLTVHDVGTSGDRVFLAMELVEGQTLARWAAEKRSWREVLAVYAAAGRGLAAAHAAGIVHRDFKPGNVLIGTNGHVRVTDFGLAREGEAVAAVEGTRGYLAPEVVRHGAATFASDQFAFCRSVQRALLDAQAGTVPARVRKALERGTSDDPSQRFASMELVLRALEPKPAALRARTYVVASGVLLAVAAVWTRRAVRPRCDGAGALAARVWSAERRAALQQAFEATKAPFAKAAFEQSSRALDAFAASWAAAREDSCRATWERGEQSQELLDARNRCLEQQLADLEALADTLAHADRTAVEKAVAAAQALPPAALCSRSGLSQRAELPADAKTRDAIAALRRQLAVAKARFGAGQFTSGSELAQTLAVEAAALHYAPLEGEALATLGDLQDSAGHADLAGMTLFQALGKAEEGHDDALAARIWVSLVRVVGHRQAHYEQGHQLAKAAQGAIDRLGGDVELTAKLWTNRGALYLGQRDDEKARMCFEQAVALRRNLPGSDQPDVAGAEHNLALALRNLGLLAEAVTHEREALRIYEASLGPQHPSLIRPLTGLANVLGKLGRYPEGRDVAERALAVTQATVGLEHPLAAAGYDALGQIQHALGEDPAALETFEKTLAILSKTQGPAHPDVAETLGNLGDVQLALGAVDAADEDYRRALEIFHAKLGSNLRRAVPVLSGAADVALARKDVAGAEALYRQAIAADADGGTPRPLLGLGEVELKTGHKAQAVELLEHAVALSTPGGAERARAEKALQDALARNRAP